MRKRLFLILLLCSAVAFGQLDRFKNFAEGTLTQGYDASATKIVLTSGGSAAFLSPATYGAYNVTWYNYTDWPNAARDPNVEIIRITAISATGDTLTILRGQNSTTAKTHNISGKVYKIVQTMSDQFVNGLVDSLRAARARADSAALLALYNVFVGENNFNDTTRFRSSQYRTTSGVVIARDDAQNSDSVLVRTFLNGTFISSNWNSPLIWRRGRQTNQIYDFPRNGNHQGWRWGTDSLGRPIIAPYYGTTTTTRPYYGDGPFEWRLMPDRENGALYISNLLDANGQLGPAGGATGTALPHSLVNIERGGIYSTITPGQTSYTISDDLGALEATHTVERVGTGVSAWGILGRGQTKAGIASRADWLYGVKGSGLHRGTGRVTRTIGLISEFGFYTDVTYGSIDTLVGLWLINPMEGKPADSVRVAYGIKIPELTGMVKYGIFQTGLADSNIFNGPTRFAVAPVLNNGTVLGGGSAGLADSMVVLRALLADYMLKAAVAESLRAHGAGIGPLIQGQPIVAQGTDTLGTHRFWNWMWFPFDSTFFSTYGTRGIYSGFQNGGDSLVIDSLKARLPQSTTSDTVTFRLVMGLAPNTWTDSTADLKCYHVTSYAVAASTKVIPPYWSYAVKIVEKDGSPFKGTYGILVRSKWY